ncbi:hypothetical protein [Promicromonospora sukumoe]
MSVDEHLAALFPRTVSPRHQHHYYAAMLHLEARRRGGESLNPEESARLKRWLDEVHSLGAIVYYDPETVDGYFLVPRLAGDEGIVHRGEGPAS